MPMNRHLTWGDRQADAARDRNLKRLQKLAAMAPSKTEEPGSAGEPSEKASKPKAKAKAAKPAKAAAKKTVPAKTKSAAKKKGGK